MDSKKKPAGQPKLTKKAYRSPVLSVYGDVRRLTGGGGGILGDSGGLMTRNCWIAEALYGVHAPRVVLVRAWLARCYERGDWWAGFVVPLYGRFGERIAAVVRFSPLMQGILRPVFDHAVRQAYCEYAAETFSRREPV